MVFGVMIFMIRTMRKLEMVDTWV